MSATILTREALNDFIKRWGVEPGGILMSSATYKTLGDAGFKALLNRVESGDWQALELAQSNFILSDIQNSILDGLKPKLLANGAH